MLLPAPLRSALLVACSLLAVNGCGGSGEEAPGETVSEPVAASPAVNTDVAATVTTYGDHASQFVHTWRPQGGQRRLPVMVLIHGGFWRDRFALDLMEPLAADLVARGWVAVNMEYRRLGELDTGWPMLLTDVAAALDSVPEVLADLGIEATTVVVTGHSAGGQLALWAGARHLLPAGAPGAGPVLRPDAVIGLAAVSDLHAAAALGLSGSVVLDLLGGPPSQVPDRYDHTSPASLVPTGSRQLLVHGDRDDVVPATMSATYADKAAAAGDPVELITDPSADHFTVIDPGSVLWARTLEALDAG